MATVSAILSTLSFASGNPQSTSQTNPQINPQEQLECKIIRDETIDGIRYVVAIPSQLVCSRQIDIELQDNVIKKVVFTRGCDGNAKGIGALIKDMTIDEAVKRLKGITCGKRPTSCPDQLARVLESLKN